MNQEASNPYSTPQAETILSQTAQVDQRTYYVDGKLLAVRHGAQLPNLCIKTGVALPDAKRKKKTLFWAHPAWALLILLGLLIYVIVYLCIRKKVTVTFSISKQASRKRFITVLSSFLVTFGSLAASIYFLSADSPGESYGLLGAIGILVFIVGLLVTAVISNLFRVKKHKDGWFFITGVGKEFLDAVKGQESHPTAT